MWPDTTFKNLIPVVQQMLSRNCGRDRTCCIAHIINTVFGCDMFKHDLQFWESLAQRDHHTVNKERLAIKNIHLRVGDLTVHQKRHSNALHRLKRF
jgi:hypothetical protein